MTAVRHRRPPCVKLRQIVPQAGTFGQLLTARMFHSVATRTSRRAVDHLINDADLARAQEDPRFKQVLLARSLEQLLDMLYRNQHLAYEPAGALSLRDGAAMAVRLADQIRALDDALSGAEGHVA